MTVFVLMGVSGSGKSTVGSQVARELADATVIDVSRAFDVVCADVVSRIRGISTGG